jgi:hypothetical protein
MWVNINTGSYLSIILRLDGLGQAPSYRPYPTSYLVAKNINKRYFIYYPLHPEDEKGGGYMSTAV